MLFERDTQTWMFHSKTENRFMVELLEIFCSIKICSNISKTPNNQNVVILHLEVKGGLTQPSNHDLKGHDTNILSVF